MRRQAQRPRDRSLGESVSWGWNPKLVVFPLKGPHAE